MASPRKVPNSWVLVAVGLIAVGLTVSLEIIGPHGSVLVSLLRAMALMGYQFVFLSIVSSAYMVELVRFFGRPFIKVHHILSVSGLVFITLHPILAAVQSRSISVFVPQFDSLRIFLQLGGRAAWYLVAVAVLAALFRNRLGGGWRVVHFLNYVAFALATVHSNLLGSNFQELAPRIVTWAMLFAILAVFVRKRLQARRTARKRAAS
jgi:sulfoxide reductase heme-binding subunit YedZ